MRLAGTLALAGALAACAAPGSVAPAYPAADPALAAQATGLKVFRGLTHTHVGEYGDDGQGTLEEAYLYGQRKAKLDFMAVSSHAHMIDDRAYGAIRATAQRFTRPGTFVALAAQEWSSISKGGHINVIEAGARCDVPNGDWATFYNRWLPARTEVGFVQFNHPHPDNPKEFGGEAFSPVAASLDARVARSRVVGMALVNGPSQYAGEDMKGRPDPYDLGKNGQNFEAEYADFLNRGWRLGAVADADNHKPNWGMNSPARTGVWAKTLAKGDLVAAFRSRRTFAAYDANVSLWFQAGGAPMGATVEAAGDVPVEIIANDPDTDIARLELMADLDGAGGRPAETHSRREVNGRSARWALIVPAPRAESWLYARVVYKDGRAGAWSSPVWLRPRIVAGAALPAFEPGGDIWPEFEEGGSAGPFAIR